MKKNKAYKYYERENGTRGMKLVCPEETLTQQHFKDEVDVDKILEKYCRTGELPKMYKEPIFEDVSDPIDFQNAQNIMAQAMQQFDMLPSKVKDRFNYDPQRFLEFMDDKENLPEMVKLGLADPKDLPKPPPKPEPTPEPTPEPKE
jgi:phage internal scaffolding protein